MIHHSNTICDDCGERHTPGNSAECIEELQKQILRTKEEIAELKAEVDKMGRESVLKNKLINDLRDARDKRIATLEAEMKRIHKCYQDQILEQDENHAKEIEAREKYKAFWEQSRLADQMTFETYVWKKEAADE